MTNQVILAIDTATPCGGIALWRDGRLLTQSLLTVPREHSRQLFVEIDEAMTMTQTDRSQLTAVSVTIGPGSFTGLRIGLSAAKGLCSALEIPLVTVSTLEVMAARVLWSPRPVACLLDARKDEAYVAVYDTSRGIPQCLEPPRAVPIDVFLTSWGGRDLFFAGDVHLLPESISGDAIVPGHLHAPDAGALAWLATHRLAVGHTADLVNVEPEYLRIPVFVPSQKQVTGGS